jgi:tripartite-type tricarboxylate transporter receptor subunit TctC
MRFTIHVSRFTRLLPSVFRLTPLRAAACAALALLAPAVAAQDYPARPVRIVTSEPGGGGDFISRTIGQVVSAALRQPIVVENRGGGMLPAIYVAKTTADGYTLLCSSGVMWIGPLLQKVSYDPVRDFSPITLAVNSPNILVVSPTLPANSLKELIALAKAKPGQLNYASAGTGGSAHLAGELLKSMAGIDMTMIPYKGAGPALIALIGNEVQAMFATATSAMAHIQSRKMKALAVTTPAPSALVPGVPTMSASGLPGYEFATITGFFAPAGTPAPVIHRLNQEINRALAMQDVKEKFLKTGVETVGNTPAAYSRIMKTEMNRLGKVIRDVGIRAD